MTRTYRISRNTSVPFVTAALDDISWRGPYTRCLIAFAFLFLVWSAVSPRTQAQQSVRPQQISVGLLAGPISGLGARAALSEPTAGNDGRSVDLSLSFNLQGYVYTSGHILRERVLPDSPLRMVIGPGMVTELDDETVSLGVSGTLGAYFLRGRYELLMQLVPRVFLAPEPRGSFGAAVGIRFRI